MSATKERGTRRDYWKRLIAGAEGKDRSKARRKPKRRKRRG